MSDLKQWRQREMMFPAFVRRMTPDDLDIATGAWKGTMMADKKEPGYIRDLPTEAERKAARQILEILEPLTPEMRRWVITQARIRLEGKAC